MASVEKLPARHESAKKDNNNKTIYLFANLQNSQIQNKRYVIKNSDVRNPDSCSQIFEPVSRASEN